GPPAEKRVVRRQRKVLIKKPLAVASAKIIIVFTEFPRHVSAKPTHCATSNCFFVLHCGVVVPLRRNQESADRPVVGEHQVGWMTACVVLVGIKQPEGSIQ